MGNAGVISNSQFCPSWCYCYRSPSLVRTLHVGSAFCCLMASGLSKDIRCHVWPCSLTADIRPNVKWLSAWWLQIATKSTWRVCAGSMPQYSVLINQDNDVTVYRPILEYDCLRKYRMHTPVTRKMFTVDWNWCLYHWYNGGPCISVTLEQWCNNVCHRVQWLYTSTQRTCCSLPGNTRPA